MYRWNISDTKFPTHGGALGDTNNIMGVSCRVPRFPDRVNTSHEPRYTFRCEKYPSITRGVRAIRFQKKTFQLRCRLIMSKLCWQETRGHRCQLRAFAAFSRPPIPTFSAIKLPSQCNHCYQYVTKDKFYLFITISNLLNN